MPRKPGGNDGRVVVYVARAAHVFSAGIKCRHCSNATYAINLQTYGNTCYVDDQQC